MEIPVGHAHETVCLVAVSGCLIEEVGAYLDKRLDNPPKRATPTRSVRGPMPRITSG